MQIEIRNPSLEARLRRQVQATGAESAEELLTHLLETQEEQDRWLIENREAIDAKIARGLAQLDAGDGIPEDRLDAFLMEQKAKPDCRGATSSRRRQPTISPKFSNTSKPGPATR